ncbi:MAG TPA: dihydrofolate reductase [Streptosporangiaceae bacterium]|nr:dihydrofolate reductase [Streptosporangiaceae bacterium]
MIMSLIVAASAGDVIGASGALPWYLPEDLRRFRRLTTGHAVIVGRLTHESIVSRLGRPLPERTSIVLSSSPAGATAAGVVWVTSLDSAVAAAREVGGGADSGGADSGGEIFVIGGASVYAQSLPLVDRVYLTRVHREVPGDTSMPPNWLDGFRLAGREDRPAQGSQSAYSWLDYVREPS